MRHYSPTDRLLMAADAVARTLWSRPAPARPLPRPATPPAPLEDAQRRHAARLMRVNHSGEVCAQALYLGQALGARSPGVAAQLRQAASEETDHLGWCASRLEDLGGRTSLLNPVWFAGSLAIGAIAGRAGDRWSLGFLAETERQVVLHLDGHLQRLPEADSASRAVLEQMRLDEASHARTALAAGGATLPLPVRGMMKLAARAMTSASHWL